MAQHTSPGSAHPTDRAPWRLAPGRVRGIPAAAVSAEPEAKQAKLMREKDVSNTPAFWLPRETSALWCWSKTYACSHIPWSLWPHPQEGEERRAGG